MKNQCSKISWDRPFEEELSPLKGYLYPGSNLNNMGRPCKGQAVQVQYVDYILYSELIRLSEGHNVSLRYNGCVT